MFKRTKSMAIALLFCAPSVLASDMDDPTRPDGYQGIQYGPVGQDSRQEAGKLNLNSVLVSEQRKIAVINDTALSIGDSIGEFTLDEVWPDKVNLRSSKGTTVLSLNPSKMKAIKHQ